MSEPTLIVGVNCYVSLPDAHDIAVTRVGAFAWRPDIHPTPNAACIPPDPDGDFIPPPDCYPELPAINAARTRALITATALLDRMRWQGRLLAPTQPLAWPRVPDRCPPGYPLTSEVPQAIITATVELALHLLSEGHPITKPIMQQMLGDAMVMFYPTIADELPKHVRRLIEPYLAASSANVAEVRF